MTSTGRKRMNAKTYTADDQALGQIAREAEAKLAAKRAARNEAREIRMRELEKQQKENEEKQDRIYELTNDIPKTSMRQFGGGSSRRGSEDSTTDEGSREMRSQLAELDEKYKKAMMGTAQLHNEKQALVYEVEHLKDQLEEREEEVIESQREFKDKCKELESKKRSYRDLETEFKNLKIQIEQRDKLIEENGLAIVISDEGEWTLVKASAPNGPLSAGLPTMGMVNSRLASEADTSLGTLKLSPKCLTASSNILADVLSIQNSSSSQTANNLRPPTALSPKQCSIGVQVSIDLPCLITSKENAKSSYFNLIPSTSTSSLPVVVSSPAMHSKSPATVPDDVPSLNTSVSRPHVPSSLRVGHLSNSSSLNKGSPGSPRLESPVWSDDDDEFYDAVNSVTDVTSPRFPKGSRVSFTGGEIFFSPIESPRRFVFNYGSNLFESSVDDSPMLDDILDESVRSGLQEDSAYIPLKVSSVDPVPSPVTSIATSLINDVFRSIALDNDGNFSVVQPVPTDKKSLVNDLSLQRDLQKGRKSANDNEPVKKKDEEDVVNANCVPSDSDEDHMPNVVSVPVHTSDEEDQVDTDIEYLEDSHPCVQLVPKDGEPCDEHSTDEEMLFDDFNEDKDEAFPREIVASTPNEKIKKGYRYKTKSVVDSNPCVGAQSKYSSYETTIGGRVSSDDEQEESLPLRGDVQPLPSAAEHDTLNTLMVSSDIERNIPIEKPCKPDSPNVDIKRETGKFSLQTRVSEADSVETYNVGVPLTDESGCLSPEVLSSEATVGNKTDALASQPLISDSLKIDQDLLEIENPLIEDYLGEVSSNDMATPSSPDMDNKPDSYNLSDQNTLNDANQNRPQVCETGDTVDSNTQLEETSYDDALSNVVNNNLKSLDLSERVDATDALVDSDSLATELKTNKNRVSFEADVEGEATSGSIPSASFDTSREPATDLCGEPSRIDRNNNEGEENSLRKEPISSKPDGKADVRPTSLNVDPSAHPAGGQFCSDRVVSTSSMIFDSEDSSDEEGEPDDEASQLKYTDDDLFEILDSPMHRPLSNRAIQGNPPLDPEKSVLNANVGSSLTGSVSSDKGASDRNEILGPAFLPSNPRHLRDLNPSKDKKPHSSKNLFGHFKSWKKKGKGSKK